MHREASSYGIPVRMAMIVLGLGAMIAPASGDLLNEDNKIMAVDGAADDEFGFSVAIDQGVVAVGSPKDDDNGASSGSAYLYHAANGSLIAKLLPSDGAAGDAFGYSIAMKNGIVAVGAPGHQTGGVASGAAYLFSASTGAQIAKLTPADAASADEFGCSIAVDGGVVAVGSQRDDDLAADSGSVYLFDVATGAQLNKLLPSDDGNRNFGVSIAMDDGIVGIGARMNFDPVEGFTLDAVYLFDVASGTQTHKLMADNGVWTDFFGTAIDIDNGLVAVGARARSIFFDHSGAAYVFDAATGNQLAYVFPSDGHDRDHFGTSIAIENGVLAIGADEDDDMASSGGSAYLFDALNGTQIDKLLASDTGAFDLFGSSIAMSDGVIAVGAIGFGSSDFNGAVYLFGSGGPCISDINSDGVLDFFDVSMFLNLFSAHDPAADLTEDGVFDFFDVAAYLDAFATGCP